MENDVKDIINKSGNGFHARVVKLLRNDNWTVLVSPYYSDNFTDKPREIDVIAEAFNSLKDNSEYNNFYDIHYPIVAKAETEFLFIRKS